MIEKDPALLAVIWSALTGTSPAVKGAAMAVVIAYLRVMYDGRETHRVRVLLEALLCGALSLCATSVIAWMALPEDLAIAVGGAVGFIGVNELRDRILRFLDSRQSDQ